MEAAPYDNVEFPVRRPGTGTWPGPGQNQASKVHIQQTTVQKEKSGKLAPLMESVELPESEDQRMQAKVYHTSHSSHSSISSHGSSAVATANTIQKPPVSPTHTSNPQQSHTLTHAQMGNTTTYVPQKIHQPLKQKKEMDQSETEEEDFDRSDFNPASQALLDKAYTKHKHFYKLNTLVFDEGSSLKQEVLDVYRKSGETLSYEQLIQGMLVDGERLLLGGCWLYFTHVEFFDPEGKQMLKEPVGRGRICLTNQRILLLTAEICTGASLSEFGDASKPSGGYKLEVSKSNNISYQNLPLSCFLNAELSATVGTTTQTKISVLDPICWGMCTCFGVGRCSRSWTSTRPMTKTFKRRTVRLGVAMPPWQTKMMLIVYLDPEMSLTTARDFVGQLQYHAPHLH